jgi:hypothetical protein
VVLFGRSSCALHNSNRRRPDRPQSHRCNWFCQIRSQPHPEIHDVLLREIVTNGMLGDKSTPAAAAAASAHWFCNALRRPIDSLEIRDEISALLAIRNTGVAHRCPGNGRERLCEKLIQSLLAPYDFGTLHRVGVRKAFHGSRPPAKQAAVPGTGAVVRQGVTRQAATIDGLPFFRITASQSRRSGRRRDHARGQRDASDPDRASNHS